MTVNLCTNERRLGREKYENYQISDHAFSTYIVPYLTSQPRIIANHWIPGRKILAARRLSLGSSTSLVQSNLVIEDGIDQCRYPYVSFSDFSKPWLERVLIYERVELNDQELRFSRIGGGEFRHFPYLRRAEYRLCPCLSPTVDNI